MIAHYSVCLSLNDQCPFSHLFIAHYPVSHSLVVHYPTSTHVMAYYPTFPSFYGHVPVLFAQDPTSPSLISQYFACNSLNADYPSVFLLWLILLLVLLL